MLHATTEIYTMSPACLPSFLPCVSPHDLSPILVYQPNQPIERARKANEKQSIPILHGQHSMISRGQCKIKIPKSHSIASQWHSTGGTKECAREKNRTSMGGSHASNSSGLEVEAPVAQNKHHYHHHDRITARPSGVPPVHQSIIK